jgi:hypothetical protein
MTDGLRTQSCSGACEARIEAMARLVFLWRRPYHLSAEEADAWTCREAARLLEADGVARVELTRLHNASAHHPSPWDWLLELHLNDGVDGHACVEAPVCAEWLGDLRLLGMRPAVALIEDSRTLTQAAP